MPFRIVLAVLLVGSLAACGGDKVESSPMPHGIVAEIDQSRFQRSGRILFVRIQNGSSHRIAMSDFKLSSPRFEDVTWSGAETLEAGDKTDIDFTMPQGRCGKKLDARITLTYRRDDADLQKSTVSVDDIYDNASYFADRDCAQLTLEEAAKVEVGTPHVTGAGRDSVLSLPVTMTPTGKRTDVRFAGFGDTVLFRQAPASPAKADIALTGPPQHLRMQVVPARCDPHALAEDKVGRLFPVKVAADDVPTDATYFLPLTKAQRIAFFDFFRSHCGIS